MANQVSLVYLKELITLAIDVVENVPVAGRENIAQLLAGTAAVESALIYRVQHNQGPARGLWQMEPKTARDIFENYLIYRNDGDLWQRLSKQWPNIVGDTFRIPSYAELATQLETDDAFAATMARLHYYRVRASIPSYNRIDEHAEYWKKYYNTKAGKGKPEDYVKSWEHFNLNSFI